MRARLALRRSGVTVALREILLRDKPPAFLETSASGTVPCLRLPDRVIDESLDIMVWALDQNDPDALLDMPALGWDLIKTNDGPFKSALDHTKYATRYPELDPDEERAKAAGYLMVLEEHLTGGPWLFGDRATLADLAILPFVRQLANADRSWFDAQNWPHLIAWLDRFMQSGEFAAIMEKLPPWSEGDPAVIFNAA